MDFQLLFAALKALCLIQNPFQQAQKAEMDCNPKHSSNTPLAPCKKEEHHS